MKTLGLEAIQRVSGAATSRVTLTMVYDALALQPSVYSAEPLSTLINGIVAFLSNPTAVNWGNIDNTLYYSINDSGDMATLSAMLMSVEYAT